MKNKGIIIGVLAVALLAIGFWWWKGKESKTKDKEVVKIGAILPLTGEAANYGTGLKKGMDLAIKEINSTSSNTPIQIIFEDDKGTPNAGIAAYNKLKSIDRVNYIIGGMFSNVALSLAPMAEKDDVILMSPTASAVEYSNFGDHVFRIYPSDTYDGDFLADFTFNQLGSTNVAILSVDAASTIEVSKIFAEKFKLNGGIVGFTNNYKQGEKNFRTILQKLKSVEAEVIFIPGYIEDIATLLKQAKELGVKKTFLTISTVYDKKLFDIVGDAAEGLIFSAPAYDANSSNAETQNFVNLYKKEYGETPDILAAYGYDVVKISYQAISKSPTKLSEIINNLYNTIDYPGVTGKMNFDKNGDVVKQLKILTVRGKSFIEY
ncbi:MAG TPA: ABC transporter substrate-binding protein [Saprospiraceae bacterium]|jgi:branched-chain amino acid transport system substrate-binding protein|nr:ABC transporter substrate-binding protein [Saprospiraceae bacterium]